MLTQINGLHHVTSIASGAQANNDFFTKDLGLRRATDVIGGYHALKTVVD